jgi:hypothetical protein
MAMTMRSSMRVKPFSARRFWSHMIMV